MGQLSNKVELNCQNLFKADWLLKATVLQGFAKFLMQLAKRSERTVFADGAYDGSFSHKLIKDKGLSH